MPIRNSAEFLEYLKAGRRARWLDDSTITAETETTDSSGTRRYGVVMNPRRPTKPVNPQGGTGLVRRSGFLAKRARELAKQAREHDLAERPELQSANAYVGRGLAAYDLGQYERAIQDNDEAIRLDPRNANAYYNRGLAAQDPGQYERAIQDYDEAIRIDPRRDACYSRGLAYHALGQYERAIQDYDEAIRLDPQYADACYSRGKAYYDLGQYERAMQDFDEAIYQLADLELELATSLADTQAFLDSVTSAVAPKLLRRDLLRSRLAEAHLAQDPDNEEYINQADAVREEAQQAQQEYDAFIGSPGASRSFDESEPARQNRPSGEVRSLYLKLVKLAHPDLTIDPEEKVRRTRSMQEVNAAYAAGDQARLEDLARQWNASPDSVQGEGIAVELVRVKRQISQLKGRIETLKREIAEARASEDYVMLSEASAEGFAAYIANREATLDAEIAQLERELMAFETGA